MYVVLFDGNINIIKTSELGVLIVVSEPAVVGGPLTDILQHSNVTFYTDHLAPLKDFHFDLQLPPKRLCSALVGIETC